MFIMFIVFCVQALFPQIIPALAREIMTSQAAKVTFQAEFVTFEAAKMTFQAAREIGLSTGRRVVGDSWRY